MKVCILGDTHIGVKQADTFMEKYQLKFFNKVLFPYLKKHNITEVLQVGDFFDSRRAVRHSSMLLVRDKLIPQIKENKQHWTVLVGNHDMGTREKIHPNACTELLSMYDCFDVVDKPIKKVYDKFEIDLIPWICKDNRVEIRDFIQQSTTPWCAGHFELSGFYFYKGVKSDGVNKKFLQNYHQVISGHFHTISSNENIQYLGTPYQLTFGDANDIRGFWILDTETTELEFVPNPFNLYEKIYFKCKEFDKTNLARFKDMFVKIIVEDRGTAASFDMLMEEISNYAHDLQIVDTFEVLDNENIKLDVSDTLKIINDYVEELDDSEQNKRKVIGIMSSLYRESINEN